MRGARRANRRRRRLMPREMLRSQRKWSKPSERMSSAHRDTWEESMACMERPDAEQSMLASVTRSFMASTIFLIRDPWTRRASNMVVRGLWR
jgi:hypothetical protein